jgi:hypothetical protein
VSDGKRLRVRIVSSGYTAHANCRFPRDIRVEGKEWEVPASAVKLQGKGKFYYTVSTKELREVHPTLDHRDLKVYDVMENGECVICSDVIKSTDFIVLAPCGHQCGCLGCLQKVDKCPMCRTTISHRVKRSELE